MKQRALIGLFGLVWLVALACSSHAQTSNQPLNSIKQVGDALSACWMPPPMEEASPGMEITVRFSFNSAGEIFGEPRFNYSTRGVSAAVRGAYQRAVAATFKRCTPMKFTPELGGALAGRPFTMRFIDNRVPPGRRA